MSSSTYPIFRMGGRAFKLLNCPRISPDVYEKVKLQTTIALQTIFSYVTVPSELPQKHDYGDIDFLVSEPLHSPTSTSIDNFDWSGIVSHIKSLFSTVHGRRGFLTTDCMYFAIRMPGHEDEDLWVQVDVKVCFKPELFEWMKYELSYATISKMKGSMVKPLGLTIDPEGLHIRVEDMDETNFPGSMVWISKDPRDVLRVMDLDRRILDAAFETKEEIYEYFASSWLFNPAHFAARLALENYSNRLEDRSPHWTHFIREWIPQHYPSYRFVNDSPNPPSDPDQGDMQLKNWNKRTRATVREKVFIMFPSVAKKYYLKRAAYVRELEECRLRTMIMDAIPQGRNGWRDSLPRPRTIIKRDQAIPDAKPTTANELTSPMETYHPDFTGETSLLKLTLSSATYPTPSREPSEPWGLPLYLDLLPREPPYAYNPSPPPTQMTTEKKLLCLTRWTRFDPTNGSLYLLLSPCNQDFTMCWTDAAYAGATDQALVNWAKEMWWHIWIRQSYTNYVGMWRNRFEKEDKKKEKVREDDEAKAEADNMVKAGRVKIMERLKVLNKSLGLIDGDATEA